MYRYSEGGWSTPDMMQPTNVFAGAAFGEALAIATDELFVSAQSNGSPSQAFVTVYSRERQEWVEGQRIETAPGAVGFGNRLDSDGETLSISALFTNLTGANQAGAVWVYERDMGNQWQNIVQLVSPNPTANTRFGSRLSVDGDWMAILARAPEISRIFRRSKSGTWEPTMELIDDDFRDLPFSNQVIIAGEVLATSSSLSDRVAVYRFDGTRWDKEFDRSVEISGSAQAPLGFDGTRLVVPDQDELRLFEFDGETWADLGARSDPAGATGIGGSGCCFAGTLVACASEDGGGSAVVFRWPTGS